MTTTKRKKLAKFGEFLAALFFKLLIPFGAFYAGRGSAQSDAKDEKIEALQEENDRLNNRPRSSSDLVKRLRAWRDKLPPDKS